MNNFFTLKNSYFFKALFSNPKNHLLLKSLLSSILEIDIINMHVELENNNLVICINDDIYCIIEISNDISEKKKPLVIPR